MVERFDEACFNSDAELVRVCEHSFDQLSVDWVQRSVDILARNDGAPPYRAPVSRPLDDLEVELTASDGVGHAKFYANGECAVTAVFLRGSSIPATWTHTDVMESLEMVLWMALTSNQNLRDCGELPLPCVSSVTRRPLFSMVTSTLIGLQRGKLTEMDLYRANAFALNFAGAYLLRYDG